MSEHDDKVFIQHFSLIIVALVIFTIAMIILGMMIHNRLVPSENPSAQARIEERLKPIAAVHAGEEGRAAVQAAVAAQQADAPAAFGGSLDGNQIYTAVCAACHISGAAGAPKLEPADWTDRMEKGIDTLYASAINGLGVMPAKGGRADLSDEQVQAAVDYMLAEIQ